MGADDWGWMRQWGAQCYQERMGADSYAMIQRQGYIFQALQRQVWGVINDRSVLQESAVTQALSAKFPDDHAQISSSETQVWQAMRMVTEDHMPMVGVMPDMAHIMEHCHDLRHGRQYKSYPALGTHAGCYILNGLGHKGMNQALLSAQVIASMMRGRVLPIPRSWLPIFYAGRFLIRSLRRGYVINDRNM